MMCTYVLVGRNPSSVALLIVQYCSTRFVVVLVTTLSAYAYVNGTHRTLDARHHYRPSFLRSAADGEVACMISKHYGRFCPN